MKTKQKSLISNQGSITPSVVIICTAIIFTIYGLLFVLTNQFNLTFRQTAYEQSLYIAEAGIQYYRWHLAHAPGDFTDNTGQPGPYIHEYFDSQGHSVGYFSLDIIPPSDGSSLVVIQSTGWTNQFPNTKRTIEVTYGIPSLTRYSHLSNASLWYGEGIVVHGRIHSNTGIRMDGINTSIVSSSQENYKCGADTGCSPTQTKPGVWGAGPNSYLWYFPHPNIDFNGILLDFAFIKDESIDKGLYLPPTKGLFGYHIVFNQDGTFNVFSVTDTFSNHAYSINEGCRRWYSRIKDETLIGTYSVSQIPIIFSEKDIWVNGVVNGRTTIAAAGFPLQAQKINIWINDNLTYLDKDSNHGLSLIAEDDIFLGRDVPNYFEVNAALITQNGKVMRHGYINNCGGNTSNAIRQSLTIYGSIVSNQKSYWNYGEDPLLSGFRERYLTYDANLEFNPPPYTPTNGEYEFISWQEK